jgi:MFS transporter, ACS family, D-galactonate transporter
LIVRCLMGIFNAPLHPAAARMVYDNVPDRLKTTANGLVTLSACLGIASTYYGLGALMDRYDWPMAFCVTSGITLIVAVVWSLGTLSRDRTAQDDATGTWVTLRGMLQLFGDRSVVAITISYAALGYFQYLFFYWIGYYFETIQHQSRDVSRQYSTLIILFMGAGMALGGWLADRIPARYPWRVRRGLVPVFGMLASGVTFVLGLFSSDPEWTFRACAISAACIGMCEGGFWTTVVEMGGSHGGTAAGFMNTGGNIGGTLSPILTPIMSGAFAKIYGESLGWKLSMLVAGIVPVLGALLWYGVSKRKGGG